MAILNEYLQPAVDLPIALEGLTLKELQPRTRKQFVNAQRGDADIANVRQGVETASVPTPDELSALSPTVVGTRTTITKLILRDDLPQLRRADELTRFLTVLPNAMANSVIRYYYKGPCASHHAPKGTASKIIRIFY